MIAFVFFVCSCEKRFLRLASIMRAIQFTAVNQVEVREVADPVPGPGEVVVKIAAAALNHRDVWIKLGQYAGLKFPCIPGSDGVGEVVAAGADVEPGAWVGRRVIINPSFGWGLGEAAQGEEFSILGLPRDGTLAEKIAVPVSQLSLAPAHLGDEEAAALPLAGLTAWRAVMSRARLKGGERVLVGGIGGGTALFALQFAVAAGGEVWVTSSSVEKIERAKRLGAKGGFDYTKPGWAEAARAEAGGLFDVIIDSAGGEGFESLVDLAAPGGRIAFFGATRGNPDVLPMRKVFWRQLSLLGTTMGSPSDWAAMLAGVERHRIKPVVSEVFAFEHAADAFALMERGGQFGKIVLKP
jgi:NADPH:quinone reductase and related Zn-dependent oxidoreductases